MARKGLTQEGLAEAIEARIGRRPGQSTVSNWTRGEKLPSNRYLPVIVEILGLSWEELGVSAGEHHAPHPSLDEPLPPERGDGQRLDMDDLVLIPRVGFVSAGPGAINEVRVPDEFEVFFRDHLIQLTHRNPDEMLSFEVVGDSMEPELRAGDTVVYVPQAQITDFGIYVLALDEQAIVKKVQRYGGGAVEIIPVNPSYSKEMLVPLPDADTPNTYRSKVSGLPCTLQVIGKVVLYKRVV